MKTLKIKYVLIVCITMLFFSACNKEEVVRDPSPLQTGVQAYFSRDNTTSYSFLPTDSPIFNILIGRNNTKGNAVVKYTITDTNNVFNLADSTIFTDGTAIDTIKVDFSKMPIGTTSTLSLKIDSLSSYFYGTRSIDITVLRDYKWVDAGIVSMTSGWAGGTADIAMQHATGTYIYRLMSPYYILEPTYCPNPGFHVQFLLDANYNAVSLPLAQDIGEAATSTGGDWWLYWNAAKSYCSFTNVGNTYTIKGALAGGINASSLTLKYTTTESFVWKTGYPGPN